MSPTERETTWSDHIYNLVVAGCQVAMVLLAAQQLGFDIAGGWRELVDNARRRYRQWEFDCFYENVWKLKKRLQDSHDAEPR